jgi:hypothetical protein
MTQTNNVGTLRSLAQGLSVVLGRLEPAEAARVSAEAAAILIQSMTRTTDPSFLTMFAESLSAVLGNDQRDRCAEAVAAAVGCLHDGPGLPGAVLLLRPAAEPFPRRLSDQQLVELLKHPLCVGPARRAVLDQLGIYHRRAFADQWEFVRFAQEQKLGLDLTSPPRRPEPFAVGR